MQLGQRGFGSDMAAFTPRYNLAKRRIVRLGNPITSLNAAVCSQLKLAITLLSSVTLLETLVTTGSNIRHHEEGVLEGNEAGDFANHRRKEQGRVRIPVKHTCSNLSWISRM